MKTWTVIELGDLLHRIGVIEMMGYNGISTLVRMLNLRVLIY